LTMHILALALFALALLSGTCCAQSHSPSAGMEMRMIKALCDQEIGDLRSGLGMRLALAAELNGYPGPRHALELANELGLSNAQRAKLALLRQ